MGAQAPLRLPAAPPLAVCGYTSVLLLFAFCLPGSRASNQPAGGGGDCPGGRGKSNCSDTDDVSLLGKKDDGLQYRPDVKDAGDEREDVYIGSHMPCPENLNGYCIHGKCEFIYSTQKASCRCESGYTGQHCEKTDFSILYVVPSRQKLTHVLIAAIIGAVQIAIIVAIVMCITRKCPKNNRGRRQKQNLGHFTSDTSSRMV